MKKVFFFGTGYCARTFGGKVIKALKSLGDFQLLGFLDNDEAKAGTMLENMQIYNPCILKECPCDLVLVFLMDDRRYKNVVRQLSEFMSVSRIHEYFYPLKLLIQQRYKDTDDMEIEKTLQHIANNGVTVFNQFIQESSLYNEVKWDYSVDLPYIDFMTVDDKTVPMYYPRRYPKFVQREGCLFVENLMWEQSEGSPHLYVTGEHNVEEGDCIIDAGVCEGNFALRYANIASRIYLFEMDPVWQEPLHYTFKNFENKVTLVNRAVSDRTSAGTCRIDDAISGARINFLKMDVEGAEVNALVGAKQTFCTNDIRASICSYHRKGDEKAICSLLNTYGYRSFTSQGYMLFLYSDDTWESGDLRRGIVYGER